MHLLYSLNPATIHSQAHFTSKDPTSKQCPPRNSPHPETPPNPTHHVQQTQSHATFPMPPSPCPKTGSQQYLTPIILPIQKVQIPAHNLYSTTYQASIHNLRSYFYEPVANTQPNPALYIYFPFPILKPTNYLSLAAQKFPPQLTSGNQSRHRPKFQQ